MQGLQLAQRVSSSPLTGGTSTDRDDFPSSGKYAESSVEAGQNNGGEGFKFKVLCDPEKPYFCDKCLSAFTSRSNLSVHVRTVHERRRPFACSNCDTFFGTRSTLRRHTKMVHLNERPFSCPLCQKKFATNSCVQRHLRKMHMKNSPTPSGLS
eukprot:Plantae.Rhodophyta-Purpureofilum_apyrenoidigerum.ctg19258.p2 GENE.Plantae.Rhodophyta-Purpureofilum_apyrenoidigerum.ctg19258~~Plantae.Rhodophyta-Purpureofilum_apyrenoidigerum.ctg19258.p2  ORF type:complete len:153 (-),score=16.50 Plantae.Rhodophyta-Purpureofilum_apyrenoidigerum.ctg19258:180-638(-)